MTDLIEELGFDGNLTAEEITTRLGELLGRASRDRIAIAVLCGTLCRLKNMRAARIAGYLAEHFPEHANDLGWVSRLCRAGILLLDYPELKDQSIDRICILRRLPKKFHVTTFHSGRLPNGSLIRDLDREQLRAEINEISLPRPVPPVEIVERKVKRELIAFANSIPDLLDQLSPIPEYSGLRLLMNQWHKELVQALQQSGPKVRETIYVSPSRSINRAVGA